MKTAILRRGSSHGFLSALFLFTVASSRADQIEMQNGDRYTGKVVALESNTVLLKSEILGTVRIRRENIAAISFSEMVGPQTTQVTEPTPVAKAPPVPVVSSSTGPNPQVNLNSTLSHHLAANSNLVNEVRSQVLSGAGPKAVQKYNSIMDGLTAGNLNVADVRKEAASVASQLRQLRGSSDDDSTAIFDEYLAILDRFVEETRSAVPPTTTESVETKTPRAAQTNAPEQH